MNSEMDEVSQKPIECLKLQPKKSILKNRVNSIDDSCKDDDLSNSKAHFDEMNIMATYHPADKDYGHMKVDEPKTPYSGYIESEDETASTSTGSGRRRVSLVGLEKCLAEGINSDPKGLNSPLKDDDEMLTEEEQKRREAFLAKRKMHYIKEAAPMENPVDVDDD